MKAVAEATGVARPTLQAEPSVPRRRGRPPLPEGEFLGETRAVVAELPTRGYRRVHGVLRRRAEAEGRPPPNHSHDLNFWHREVAINMVIG